jgi:hypothetical protein
MNPSRQAEGFFMGILSQRIRCNENKGVTRIIANTYRNKKLKIHEYGTYSSKYWCLKFHFGRYGVYIVMTSQITFESQFRERLLDIIYGQWALLGIPFSQAGHTDEVIDPEALI